MKEGIKKGKEGRKEEGRKEFKKRTERKKELKKRPSVGFKLVKPSMLVFLAASG